MPVKDNMNKVLKFILEKCKIDASARIPFSNLALTITFLSFF